MSRSVTGGRRLLLLVAPAEAGVAVGEEQLDPLDLGTGELAEVEISLASKSPEPVSVGIASTAHTLPFDEIRRAGAVRRSVFGTARWRL